MIKGESWKLYENGEPYLISNYGNVFNLRTMKPMSIQTDRYGYNYVSLSLNSKKIKKKIHRMVCESFLPNPENKPQVNHKNGIKTDNRLENLEWSTAQENTLHCYRILSADGHIQKEMSIKRKGIKPNPDSSKKGGNNRRYGKNGRAKPILCIENNTSFSCAKEASDILDIDLSTIFKSLKTGKAVKGFHFKRILN